MLQALRRGGNLPPPHLFLVLSSTLMWLKIKALVFQIFRFCRGFVVIKKHNKSIYKSIYLFTNLCTSIYIVYVSVCTNLKTFTFEKTRKSSFCSGNLFSHSVKFRDELFVDKWDKLFLDKNSKEQSWIILLFEYLIL